MSDRSRNKIFAHALVYKKKRSLNSCLARRGSADLVNTPQISDLLLPDVHIHFVGFFANGDPPRTVSGQFSTFYPSGAIAQWG